jgi:hypothetical protein
MCHAASSFPMPASAVYGYHGDDYWDSSTADADVTVGTNAGANANDAAGSETGGSSTTAAAAATILTMGAYGNKTTCNIQGLFNTIGESGSLACSVSFAVHFLLIIKFNVTDRKIKTYIEPFYHAMPVALTAFRALCLDLFSGQYCFVMSNLYTCTTNDGNGNDHTRSSSNDYEDESSGGNDNDGDDEAILFMIVGLAFPLVAFLFNCIVLTFILLAVKHQVKQSQTTRLSWMSHLLPNTTMIPDPNHDESNIHDNNNDDDNREEGRFQFRRRSSLTSVPPSPLITRLTRPSKASARRLKGIYNRIVVYIVGFMITYLFTIIYRFLEIMGMRTGLNSSSSSSSMMMNDDNGTNYHEHRIPFTIMILSRSLIPLQGLFNLITYTYPHVVSYRRQHRTHSWFHSFWNILKSGGDNDRTESSRRLNVRRENNGRRRRIRRRTNTSSVSRRYYDHRSWRKKKKQPFPIIEGHDGHYHEDSMNIDDDDHDMLWKTTEQEGPMSKSPMDIISSTGVVSNNEVEDLGFRNPGSRCATMVKENSKIIPTTIEEIPTSESNRRDDDDDDDDNDEVLEIRHRRRHGLPPLESRGSSEQQVSWLGIPDNAPSAIEAGRLTSDIDEENPQVDSYV